MVSFGRTYTGKYWPLAVTTSIQTLVNNAASSGTLTIVQKLFISNVDGTNAADVTLSHCSQDDVGGTAWKIGNTISVPADSTIEIDGPIYLEEDKSLGALASANSDIEIIAYGIVIS